MDVSFLEPVFSASGPYATVCADVTHTTENADTEVGLRVRGLAEKLTEQGAPDVVVEAVRSRLLEANEGGEIATLRGRAQEVAEYSPAPDLMPVLRQLPGRVPHIVVITDRVGADISVASLVGRPEIEDEVEGDSFQIHKFQGGGWAHHRYQHNTENKWIHNADNVAERIASLVRRLHPRFVLLAGDTRARQILTDRASDLWSELIVSMDEGGRAAGADRQPVDRRAAELVAEHEAHEEADAVEKLASAGAHGLAVTGKAAVVEALRKGQVETLVLADQQDPDDTLIVGNSPLELGVDQHDMDALGTHGEAVPGDRALLAAAVARSAGVVVVPRSAMPGNAPVAAVLRYTDASTPTAD
jgi:hypothetical protein